MALALALAAASAVAVAVWLGEVRLSHGAMLPKLLVAAGLGVLTLWRGPRSAALSAAALWCVGLGAALVLAPHIASSPRSGAGLVLVLVLAAATLRWRAPVVVAAFAVSGAYMSLQALTPLPVYQLEDALLGGLYLGAVLGLLLGRPDAPPRRALGAAGVVAFVAFAYLRLALDPLAGVGGHYAFHVLEWYMLAAVALAVVPWRRPELQRLAHGVLWAAAVVGGYAVFRWIAGPAAAERALVLSDHPVYNFTDGELNVFGSFANTRSLGVWTTTLVPFALAAALGLRGRRRWLAAAAAALCFAALLGSHLRAGIPAVAAGAVVVISLQAATRAHKGLRLGVVAAASLALLAGGVGVLARSPGAGSSSKSYEAIVRPEQDASYAARQIKWSNAMREVRRHPWGQGMGTSGQAQVRYGAVVNASSHDIDNSYLNVLLQLGYPGLLLFAGAVAALLTGLARRGLRAGPPESAAVAAGAAGALVAFLVVAWSGNYVEGLPALPVWLLSGLGLAGASAREAA